MSRRGGKMQEEVMAALNRRATPMSAYDLHYCLRRDHPRLSVPTIYRALAALIDRGRAHRLESLNAYVTCRLGRQDGASVLSVCRDCGCVDEDLAPEVADALSVVTGRSGFVPDRHVIELHGRCAACDAGQTGA